MPRRACIETGCKKYAAPGKPRCLPHCREFERTRWERGATGRRGSRPGWRRLRARVLRDQTPVGGVPICGHCGFREATEVHHKDGDATNDSRSNLVGVCSDCHKILDAAIRKARRGR